MSSLVTVAVHASQSPQRVRQALLASLRTRRLNHKFHYDSLKQSQKWLALHQAHSPSRNDPDCAAIYRRSFEALANRLAKGCLHLIGLGCGGGQKDARLLKLLQAADNDVFYMPTDVSLPLVLTAHEAALAAIPESHCSPLVCDLAEAEDLVEVLENLAVGRASGLPPSQGRLAVGIERENIVLAPPPNTNVAALPSSTRLFTFFGMLPNFEPDHILPRLAQLARPGDWLLLSANLAPGNDYAAGVQRILPQYDNELTRDWLLTFLLDLGVDKAHGELRFVVENVSVSGLSLKRVTAYFHFARTCEIQLEEERFQFRKGEALRLFFSYRFTPALGRTLLQTHGLTAVEEWLTDSGEEAVFLARSS